MILLCRSISASAVEMENAGQDCEESENKRALSVDSDVFPASHEGRCNAVSCQDCFFNWLPCADHRTVLWTPEAAVKGFSLVAY